MSGTSNNAINIMMLGDGAVGKTCILSVFYNGQFIEEHHETM